MKRNSFDRVDDVGPTSAFIARGDSSVGVIVRIQGKNSDSKSRAKLLNENEWFDLVNLVHAAPSMRTAIKAAAFFADVEAANVDQTPDERERWLEIGRILKDPLATLREYQQTLFSSENSTHC
jgi:hypothetical protein